MRPNAKISPAPVRDPKLRAMIIWGFRVVWRTIAEGVFHCPQEEADKPYRLRSARRFFTLFFIPLIPLKKMGQAVECQGCKQRFEPTVLARPTAPQMATTLYDAVRCALVSILEIDGGLDPKARHEALRVIHSVQDDGAYSLIQLDADLRLFPTHDLESQLNQAKALLQDDGREHLLTECIRVAAADGPISVGERHLLGRIGRALGLSDAHVLGVMQTAIPPAD